MRLSALITPLLALATCLSANAQRYCNPLPMPIGLGGNASGDVTVLEEGGKYYMCCTGGGMWVSDNLLDWEFHAVEHIPVAPDLVKYKGKFYLTGNSDHVFVADHPLGPYQDLGLFKNTSRTPVRSSRAGTAASTPRSMSMTTASRTCSGPAAASAASTASGWTRMTSPPSPAPRSICSASIPCTPGSATAR